MKILEVIISIGIIGIIVAGVAGSFGGLRGGDALTSSTETVLSALSTARSQTLAYKENARYSVHFASSTVTVFPGTVWSEGLGSTTVFTLVPGVVVSAVNVTGGGVDVAFDRFTGKTLQYGTTTLQAAATLATSTIVIQKTGVVFQEK